MRAIRVSVVVSILLVMLAVQTVTATHWTTRTVVAKSVSQECAGGTKIDSPESGVGYIVFYDGFQGSITFTLNGTLSFATDQPAHVITSLLIAGGPSNAVLYTWAGGTNSDEGLTAPDNPNSGKPYGFSHICIYTAKK
jgi:hypothetical protein